ncbi:MAG: ribonucleotide-diphosphate reductase, partial [Mycoplasma sp.]|nr:ribonucleotide-diphosphate reductase [Mycoplasma sp.]
IQSNIGMPYITNHIKSLQNKSILSFMGMMEGIHAKSYSTIFTTIETQENINNVFKWVENNKELQYKANKIDYYYNKLLKPKVSNYDLAMALASSVLLESFLFYSGFFLPLWLAGQGKMVASSDIIKKIIADESIHGVFVGLLFQEIFNKFDFNEKIKLKKELNNLIDNLIENE